MHLARHPGMLCHEPPKQHSTQPGMREQAVVRFLPAPNQRNYSLQRIADISALASAAKLAEGRGAMTSQVLKHLAHFANFQAEASAK